MTVSPRRAIIAGNWKMYKTTAEARTFAQALIAKLGTRTAALPDIVVCPPYTSLSTVQDTFQKAQAPVIVAAQNMESRDQGAYTGEVSPLMLQDLGVKWVVIGHSERRQYFNETDKTVNEKTLAALKHGMTPIVCVGESLAERDGNQTDAVIQRQVEKALEGVDPADYPKIVVAYEPVWAIGTGKVCASQEANRVCELIRQTLAKKGSGDQTRILYGGSVKPDNSQELMSKPHIDGALVGGASLDAEDFFQIIEATRLAKV
jgi:triosephosphate isomerase